MIPVGRLIKIADFLKKKERKEKKPKLLQEIFDFLQKADVHFERAERLRREKDDLELHDPD